jgi:hypothetical protein
MVENHAPRWLDPARGAKPLDLGNGEAAASVAPDGRLLAVGGFDRRLGYLTLEGAAAFPAGRRGDQAAVRAYRAALAEPSAPGFGLVPQRPWARVAAGLLADSIPVADLAGGGSRPGWPPGRRPAPAWGWSSTGGCATPARRRSPGGGSAAPATRSGGPPWRSPAPRPTPASRPGRTAGSGRSTPPGRGRWATCRSSSGPGSTPTTGRRPGCWTGWPRPPAGTAPCPRPATPRTGASLLVALGGPP